MKKLILPILFLLIEFQSFSQNTLIHYWHFNSFVSGVSAAANPSTFIPYRADFSLLDTNAAKVIFKILPGTSSNYTTFWDGSTTGDTTNSRMSAPAGKYLRLRNPSDSMQLQFFLPSTGFKDLMVSYTLQRSSASNGATIHRYSYSLDSGSTWQTTGLSIDSFVTSASWTTTPVAIHINNAFANNNSKFVFRIIFSGTQNTGTSGNNRIDNFTMDGTSYVPATNVLLHYWHFNTFVGVSSATNPNTLTPVVADSSRLSTSLVKVAYRTIGGTSANYTTYWDDVTGIDSNTQYGTIAGNGMRFRNPTDSMMALFYIPSTGYYEPTIRFATQKSSTSNGAAVLRFSYSVDSGTTWLSSGLSIDSFITTTAWKTVPEIKILNTNADNNPNLVFKINFIPPGNTSTSGNTRMDNFTVSALTAPGGGATGDVTPPVVSFTPVYGAGNIMINTHPVIGFNEEVRLIDGSMLDSINVDTIVGLRLNNATGSIVPFNGQLSSNKRFITLVPTSNLSYSTSYYIALKPNLIKDTNNNIVTLQQNSTFTTELVQTIFNPGDILPLAYRMNASGADDEIALLTFVNILPGTKIKMTDAKYTTNLPAQCAGGIEWTAPSGGVPSGSVIKITTDNGVANLGTISGSTFGLSSGGDQVMIYTGTNFNPSYLTALSSSTWLTTNTSCSGSFSMLPSTLTNYVNAFSLNAVNAYYNGNQTGTLSQLKQSLLDTTNWIGASAGSLPQPWPNWNFFGPPTVVSAVIKNATTIEVVFNSSMDSASCVSQANYTGIANLNNISFSSNGSLADTVLLHFSTAFSTGINYTLTINNVKNTQNQPIFTPYIFTFTYETSVEFEKDFMVVEENAGTFNIQLNLTHPSTSSIIIKLKPAPWSNGDSTADFTFSTQQVNFSGSSNNVQYLSISVNDDNIKEQDEYFVLEITSANNLNITGKTLLPIYIRDNDNAAPIASKTIELNHITSFDPNPIGSSTEVVVFDSTNQILITTSALQNRFDIVDFSNPISPQTIHSVDVSTYGGITSVAVFDGLIAVACPNTNEQLNGSVLFYNASGVFQKQVTVGALPDMITFNNDGSKVLTANEGQPNTAYTIDPEGSISVIDLSSGIANLTQGNVKTLGFNHFNSMEATLLAAGIRKTKSTSSLAQDFEPEYITISDDNTTAWVSLQENNSIAQINLNTDSIIAVIPLGTKNMNQMGNGFDAGNKNNEILISNWPIKAFYMPDALSNFTQNGNNFIVMANEGDEKDYDGLNERTTVGKATTILDSVIFPHAQFLKETYNLGNMRITTLNGNTDNDGAFEELYCVGPRSFSIWNASLGQMVFESGDMIERITASHPKSASVFNADNEDNNFKGRSHAKGPEPEGITTSNIAGHLFAFITLERTGGIMVFDISDPANPSFVDYNNTRNLASFGGDNGPETVIFIKGNQTANGKNYLVVANEISGTLTIYEVIDNISSIETLHNDLITVKLYPNPNNLEKVYFSQNANIELFNIKGQKLNSCENCSELNISNLSKGVYLVRINGIQIQKLIVN